MNSKRKKISAGSVVKLTALGLLLFLIMGGLFGGYLYYKAYYAPGWHEKDGNTYYVAKVGENATGLYSIDGITYLFDSSGKMLTGWQKYRGNTYYFADDGIMQKGKIMLDGTTRQDRW